VNEKATGGEPRSSSVWLGYLLAVIATIAAFLITVTFIDLFARTPLAIFFIFGGILTLWFGVGPGLVVAALTVLMTSILLKPPIERPQVVGFLAISLPTIAFISRHRHAVRALRDSERRYQHLTELSNDVVLLDGLDGRIQSINATGTLLSGYRREDVIGRQLTEFIVPEHVGRALEGRNALLAPGGPKTVEVEVDFRTADGHVLTIEGRSGLALADGRVVGFHSVARDVTERRRLEAQLRQSQKMEAIGRLAGGIAHDFNNLLTASMGYADSALAGIGPAHPQAGNLRSVLSVCERAAGLIRQLLAFSRQQALEPTVLDPNEAVGGVESMLQRLIGADVKLTISLDASVGSIKADPNQLMQVLINLAVNARDAMSGGGTLTIETASIAVPDGFLRGGARVEPGRYVVIAVIDSGSGMDAETQARIFEPFFTTKPDGAGTGLGLATVYGIVKQSGGYIWVDSQVGRGTRFEILLPRVDAPIETGHVELAEPETLTGTETILLAEDDADVRELVRETLTGFGYTVLALPDGATAATVSDQGAGRIDLILSDVIMPQLSGPELVAHVRRTRPMAKALFMSGFVYPGGHPRTYGIDAPLLQKPFTPQALAREVRRVLDGAEPDRA